MFKNLFSRNKKYKKLKFAKSKNISFKYKKEILGIILFSLFAITTLAFISYNPTDNSWFYFSSGKYDPVNWVGIVGAHIAALLFFFFGSAAYVFNLIILFMAFFLFFKKSFRQEWDRFLALFLLLISSTTFLRIYQLDFTKSFPGGLLGDNLLKLFSFFFAVTGTKILIFTIFLISTIIFFRISLFILAQNGFELGFSFLKKGSLIVFDFSKVVFQKLGLLIFTGAKFCLQRLKSIFRKKEKQDFGEEEIFFANSPEHLDFTKVLSDKKELGPIMIENKVEPGNEDLWNSLSAIAKSMEEGSVMDTQGEEAASFDTICKANHSSLRQGYDGHAGRAATSIHWRASDFAKASLDTQDEPELKKRIEYQLPDTTIFKETKAKESWIKELEQESLERGKKLEEKLSYFGIKGKVTAIRPGPVITLFEYKPEIDSKISKIVSLEDDLAMALTALSIRIVAPIPGKNVIGFEISNQNRQDVFLSDILRSKEFKTSIAKLPLSFGVDIVGKPVIENLVKMPHLLVAGSTGSGKSVGLNSMLVSLLCMLRPDQLKLILIDPKRLEFAPFADIPHLLFPIITNPRKAAPVLKWLVQEMEDRYDKLATAGVKSVTEYQKLATTSDRYENMPFIVLMIDELADLMMVAGKDIETQVARIAQMARAAGIHMIMATQRPSVDVVTGIIKVNFPSRIAYRVSSKIDSRTIIDDKGAEKLLGLGDLLYMNSISSDLKRIHGAYISDKEIEKLTSHLKAQQKVEYLDLNDALRKIEQKDLQKYEDELYPKVLEFLKAEDEISISQLQRYYKIGFNRSARIIERLELDGIIAPSQGSKPRKVIRE